MKSDFGKQQPPNGYHQNCNKEKQFPKATRLAFNWHAGDETKWINQETITKQKKEQQKKKRQPPKKKQTNKKQKKNKNKNKNKKQTANK